MNLAGRAGSGQEEIEISRVGSGSFQRIKGRGESSWADPTRDRRPDRSDTSPST